MQNWQQNLWVLYVPWTGWCHKLINLSLLSKNEMTMYGTIKAATSWFLSRQIIEFIHRQNHASRFLNAMPVIHNLLFRECTYFHCTFGQAGHTLPKSRSGQPKTIWYNSIFIHLCHTKRQHYYSNTILISLGHAFNVHNASTELLSKGMHFKTILIPVLFNCINHR